MTEDEELAVLYHAHLVTGLTQRELGLLAFENVPRGSTTQEGLAWTQGATSEQLLNALRHSVRRSPDLWMSLLHNVIAPGNDIVLGVIRGMRG